MARSGKLIRGQHVEPDKLSLAKRLRRDMTPSERLLWQVLRRNAIDGFHFRRQQVIEGYIVDFYCDAARLAIELDGHSHEEQWIYDESRDAAICGNGVRILRIPNDAVKDIEALIEHIREALRIAGKPNP